MPPNGPFHDSPIPLNTPEGQRLLGARDVIAEEAFRVVTDPCDIPDLHCGVITGNVGFAVTNPTSPLHIIAPRKIRSTLYLTNDLIRIESEKPLPNAWIRFWHRALLGWRWEGL